MKFKSIVHRNIWPKSLVINGSVATIQTFRTGPKLRGAHFLNILGPKFEIYVHIHIYQSCNGVSSTLTGRDDILANIFWGVQAKPELLSMFFFLAWRVALCIEP